MALVLALQEGRSFYVGSTKVTVEEIVSPSRVKMVVHGGRTGLDNLVEVTDTSRVEMESGVHVMVGLGSTATLAKIAIEAPRNVRILRDSLYEQGND